MLNEWLLWLSLGAVFYTYAGYPLLLALAAPRAREPSSAPQHRPQVTVIVAAYNEERFIGDKITTTLAGDYPAERLQLIVVSDGSDDRTEAIVAGFRDPRVQLLRSGRRGGKAAALNLARPHARGEVLVYSDANVMFRPDALARLVEHFADPRCGLVSGRVELQSMDDEEPLGEGAYMRYERFVCAKESALHSMVGTDGGMFAVRAELVGQVPEHLILDDFYIAMGVAAHGYRLRYEPRAQAVEKVPARVSQEFRRKVRIAAGGFQVLGHMALLRRPWRAPLFVAMFVSHKLLRWLSGFVLLTALAANVALADRSGYALLLALQAGGYGAALGAQLARPLRRHPLFYPFYYFAAINLACVVGFFRFLRQRQPAAWQRVDR
ncbi:MAG: glycosyltransferase family 2 protein [Gammaproteobacteria bacterium]|nr:glycosyltransferase family 2 protein [Gammaproteobacteria bacterium]